MLSGPLSRSQLFAWTFALGCVNGLGSRVIETVRAVGWSDAVVSTFEVSAIVWIACVGGLTLLSRDEGDQIRGADIAVAGALLVLIALPIGGLSWLAIALLSLYVVLLTNPPSARRRGAMILLAVTVPMLWSRLLFRYFAPFILDIDASLISLLLGMPRTGNLVRFVDGSGSLAILPYCSSLHNVSLVVLTWVAINQWLGRRWSSTDWQWIVLAVVAVVAINVTRMSLMGLTSRHYQAIHGLWGDTITNLLILGAIVGICALGVRRELLARS